MLSDHLEVDSPPPSHELRFCWWGSTCTRSFFSGEKLMQHVLDAHVSTAVSVSREENSMLLRTTEGIGDSYETEHFLSFQSRIGKGLGDWRELKNHSQDSNDSGPVASLPSPPVSSSSRPLGHDDNEDFLPSGSESPRSQARDPSPMFYEDSDPNDFTAQSNVLLSDALEPPSPRFGKLDAPSGSPRPGAIPPSPSFSDILASSTQKGPAKPQSPIHGRLLTHKLSSNSSSSANSCALVEEQLTPADDDLSFDEDRDRPSQTMAVATTGSNDSDLYRGELNWVSSQAATQKPIHSESSSPSQVSSGIARDYGDVIPRRPSLHVHGVQDTSLQFSTSSRESPSRKQSWYGPTTRPRKRSRGHNLSPSVSPMNTPAISPHRTLAFAVSPDGNSRARDANRPSDHFASHPKRIRDNPSHSALHRKRYKLDSFADTNATNLPPAKIRHTMTMQRPLHGDEFDADVSQNQVETQFTMSPPVPQESQHGMYHYPIQTQAPYDSQS